MALVEGTNCGFVTVAPTADPQASTTEIADTYANAVKFTSPVGATKVTEIGWYCSAASEEADTDVGIYSHDSQNNEPNTLLGSATFAKGTTAGWKKATVDIAITGGTIYWLAIQCDDTATDTLFDVDITTDIPVRYKLNQTSLSDPWGAPTYYYGFYIRAIYAVYEVGAAYGKVKINIGDVFKETDSIKVNISDSWKTVESIKINISDTWKTVF